MPITLNCPCGKTLRVPDASAGKRAKCPLCNAVVTVPAPEPPPEPEPEPEPVFEIVEDAPAPVPPPRPYKKPFADEDEDDNTPYGLASPERDEPAPGASSGGVAKPKKGLPNFRIGTDNHT